MAGNDFDDDMFPEENFGERDNYYDEEVGIQQSQKPESFHHFILENQYRDLEMSIRGYKDVYQKETRKWVTKRKEKHCFTDEESEEILRCAQSHLSTDIKLSYINKEAFPLMMDALYKQLELLFRSMAEYRYGRYGDATAQYQMKLMNLKIFGEMITRIQANYSRAIMGMENKYTHESVKGQESLQSGSEDPRRFRSYT